MRCLCRRPRKLVSPFAFPAHICAAKILHGMVFWSAGGKRLRQRWLGAFRAAVGRNLSELATDTGIMVLDGRIEVIVRRLPEAGERRNVLARTVRRGLLGRLWLR